MASGFAGGFAAGIVPGIYLGKTLRERKIEDEVGEAGKVSPEELDATTMTETTPGAENLVYDEETGQYLPRYMGKDGKPTEQAQAQLNMPEGGASEAPEGLVPTHSAKTTKRYRMGGKEQDAPFLQEQIDAQRFRKQADVYSRYGRADDAAKLQGLAKTREEEGVSGQIRAGAMEGLKGNKDMKDEEKMFSMSKGMYEQAIKLGRPDLAASYYNQMSQNRDALLTRANDRADRVFRATGNVSGFVDAYNRYVADGLTIDSFKRNEDGSHVFTMNDGTGNTRDISVPKERTQEYLMALRDPKRIGELEAKRAEILFKSRADAEEALNKPVAVGKDQTLVVPRTGQTFAPGGGARGFDPKEAGPVLDDARKILLEQSGNFDQATGKWNWSPETRAKSVTAERLFMKNPTLGPAQLAEISDKGSTGMATVEINGKQQRVPAITYNGRTFLLGDDAGHSDPAKPGGRPPAQVTTSGLGTREVRGKISGLEPVQPKKTEPVAFNAPELDRLASETESAAGLPKNLLLAIKNAGERSNNNQVSPKGAAGVMQFMPETAKAYGVDPTDPPSAIRGAGRMMADLVKQYGGNVAAAVAHYNGGVSQGRLVAAGKEPSYPETRAYLARVLAAMNQSA
jgi:hypothetical protein